MALFGIALTVLRVGLLSVAKRPGDRPNSQHRYWHAGDRRRNVVELTDAGQTALVEAVRASNDAEQQLLADLDDTEAAQLRTLLTRLARDRTTR